MPDRDRGQRLAPGGEIGQNVCWKRGGEEMGLERGGETYHERPIASMLEASSHTATFVASDTQYAM